MELFYTIIKNMKNSDTTDMESASNDTESSETQKPNGKTLSLIEKIQRWYRKLPDKKQYLEFFTALLTIPVLLTVIVSNVQNLQRQNATNTPTPQVSVTPIPTIQEPKNSPTPTATSTPTTTPSAQCVKEVGPVSITYPLEGSTISTSPVSIDISRTGKDYCAVVWSYRINEGSWSEYTDKSINIYGLTAGTKNLELKVKSIVTGSETLLTRSFIVAGGATPTPTSTSSASLN